MSALRSPPRREAKLRLALWLASQLNALGNRPQSIADAVDQVLYRLQRLSSLRRLYDHCTSKGWHTAMRAVLNQQSAQLRELGYALNAALSRPVVIRPVVTAAHLYRDLVALSEEFDDLQISDDLSTLSVVTDPITLEEIGLGRFRLELDLNRLTQQRFDGRLLTAHALDPNPAAGNDEITHPHVQGSYICLGEGSELLRVAFSEGRLYDGVLIVSRVLHTYNAASPYVSLDHWHARRCEECDDRTPEDELYSCQRCGMGLCGSCECACTDCQDTHCRRCLDTDDHDDLLCRDCLAQRQADAEDEPPDPKLDSLPEPSLNPLPEMLHAPVP